MLFKYGILLQIINHVNYTILTLIELHKELKKKTIIVIRNYCSFINIQYSKHYLISLNHMLMKPVKV